MINESVIVYMLYIFRSDMFVSIHLSNSTLADLDVLIVDTIIKC